MRPESGSKKYSRGHVIPKGTTIPWQEQIDRQMLESSRHRITVLRTWAFDDNPDAFAFQPALGEYNEEAFRKLDYIVDSARRHGIRVILTFTNYWPDYGGIARYTSQLGLANKTRSSPTRRRASTSAATWRTSSTARTRSTARATRRTRRSSRGS